MKILPEIHQFWSNLRKQLLTKINEDFLSNKMCIVNSNEIYTNKTQKGDSHEEKNIQTRYNFYHQILVITDYL